MPHRGGYDSFFEPDPDPAAGLGAPEPDPDPAAGLGGPEPDPEEPASPPPVFGALVPVLPPGSPTPRCTVGCFLLSF